MARALVTGAGRGLGRAIAGRLRADGCEVVVLDVDAATAQATAVEIGAEARHCDVTDKGALGALADELGPLDVLVNNAGIWRFGPLLDADPADIEAVLQVNLLGALNCCRAFVPAMAGRGRGSIVNISSAAADTRSPGVQIYPVSKGAIETLTRQLALELAPAGIRVNAVGPGLTETEGTSARVSGEPGAARARSVPLGRIGTPADIASAVAFLASEHASYITGQVLYVDGGVTAGRAMI